MKTPINAASLKQHLTYCWWKYLLAAVLSVFLVNLIYTVTAYRSPPEKTVSFFVYGYTDEESLSAYLENVRETEMQDMESVDSLQMLDDSNYGPMQLMTYLAVGEGNVYLLPREQFLSSVSSGALTPLEGDGELLALFTDAGVSLQSGWRKDTETGENHLYGIPQNKLPGLSQYAAATDGFLCIPIGSRNVDNTFKFLRILCRDTLAAPSPEEAAASPAD